MEAPKHTVVSLFTGAGGLDIGLEQAGFRVVSAIDDEPDCVATLSANQQAEVPIGEGRAYFDGTTIVAGAVESLEAGQLVPRGAGHDWVPDLLAGGPPCQPFSSSGKMLSVEDPRGRLFQHFVRLAGELRPRLILFENVRGLVTSRGPSGEPGEVLSLVTEAFESIGYATTWALLNAADYGAAQRRVRCFLMATRGTALPEFPPPTHAERPEGGLFDSRRPWVSLGELLGSLPPPTPDEIVRPTATLAAQLAHLPPGSGLKSAGAREATRPAGGALGLSAGHVPRGPEPAGANRYRLGQPRLGPRPRRLAAAADAAGVRGAAGISASVAVRRAGRQPLPPGRQRRPVGLWQGAGRGPDRRAQRAAHETAPVGGAAA